jgi:hypothetical protein
LELDGGLAEGGPSAPAGVVVVVEGCGFMMGDSLDGDRGA